MPPRDQQENQLGSSRPLALERQLAEAWPTCEWRATHVVLGVSGGADSIALLRALATLKDRAGGPGKLFVAHLDHGLRGEEAQADVLWLRSLCNTLQVPLETASTNVNDLARLQGNGWEAAARSARYDFLTRTAERFGARYVATAHTADDQAETVLHRIVRGSGLAGLAGIPQRRRLSASVTLVRPLLAVNRQDVLAYLRALGQEFREDSSNTDPRFTRNRIRHVLLPFLRNEFNAEVDQTLIRLALQAGEMQELLDTLVGDLFEKCVVFEDDRLAHRNLPPDESNPRAARIRVDTRPLAGQPMIVVCEVLKTAWQTAGWPLQAMGFAEWRSLATRTTPGDTASPWILPGNIRARNEAHLLVLETAMPLSRL